MNWDFQISTSAKTVAADPQAVGDPGEFASRVAFLLGEPKAAAELASLVVQKKTGRVIGGNGRLLAMRKLEWKDCDIVEVDVDDLTATVDVQGARRDISLMLMPEEVAVGDYVLVHAGFAIHRWDKSEVEEKPSITALRPTMGRRLRSSGCP